MKFSAFTPMGLFRFSGAKPEAQVIYESKVRELGVIAGKIPAYATVEPGSRLHAKLFAESIREAVIRMLIRRAADCDIPGRVHPELIPLREIEYGIQPPQGQLMHQRRRALEAAYRLPLGGSRFNIEATFRKLLGAGFVYYRTFDAGAGDVRALYPTQIGASPMNLKRPNAGRVLITLDSVPGPDGPIPGISMPSTAPQKVYYSAVVPDPAGGAGTLYGGEDLVVEPAISARCERVLVTEVGEDSVGKYFKAAFAQAHEPGCFGTTQPFPFWMSIQRHAHIVVTPEVAADTDLVRQIHILMRQLARGVSTWSVCEASSPTTAGPFYIGTSPLGTVPLGEISFPFLPPAGP